MFPLPRYYVNRCVDNKKFFFFATNYWQPLVYKSIDSIIFISATRCCCSCYTTTYSHKLHIKNELNAYCEICPAVTSIYIHTYDTPTARLGKWKHFRPYRLFSYIIHCRVERARAYKEVRYRYIKLKPRAIVRAVFVIYTQHRHKIEYIYTNGPRPTRSNSQSRVKKGNVVN